MLFHEVPFGLWMATTPEGTPSADWFLLNSAARVDTHRKAEKAAISSGIAQAIHEHEAGGARCNRHCVVVVPGPAPAEIPDG